MKTLPLLLLCGAMSFTAALAQTQTQTAPPAPAVPGGPPTPTLAPTASPKPRVAPAPGSMPAKNLPTEPVVHGGSGIPERSMANIQKAQAQGDAVQLIFDGDSITDFWPKRAAQLWTDRYARFGTFDFGISGDTTNNLLWRLAQGQAAGLHPRLIVLMIGTNNMRFSSTPAEIADGVKAILAGYQKVCPGAVILLQAIFPRGPLASDPYRIKVKATNAILATFGDGKKIIYTDFSDKFLAPDGALSPDIMPDYLHPSAKGYQIWADAIQPYIDKYAGK